MHDRKVKLQDPHPVYQKLLLRDDLRVKQFSILVSIAEVITRAVLFHKAFRILAVFRLKLKFQLNGLRALPLALTAEEESIGRIICLAGHGISCPGKLGLQRRDVGVLNMKPAKDMAFGCTMI